MEPEPRVGFVVIYRWRLRAGCEARFVRAWEGLTWAIRRERGGLGSRLHRSEDGRLVAYAQWPDEATWRRARELPSPDPAASAEMSECVLESERPEPLRPRVDLLVRADLAAGGGP